MNGLGAAGNTPNRLSAAPCLFPSGAGGVTPGWGGGTEGGLGEGGSGRSARDYGGS